MRQVWAFVLAVRSWLATAPVELFNRLTRRAVVWQFERVEDFPDKLVRGRVYLAGDGDDFWGAAMTCPCGCCETIVLNMLPQVRPRWSTPDGFDGLTTLQPSIWRQSGCRSHFFVRKGKIDWC